MADKTKKPQGDFRLREAARAVVDQLPGIVDELPEVVRFGVPTNSYWNVVVAGAVDPRQHHPTWYSLIECLSEAELKQAISNLNITPMQWMFSVTDFMICVQGNRWEIATRDKDKRERILQISEKVFSRLFDIPISAIGVNCVLELETKATSVRLAIRDKMVEADLGLPSRPEAESQIIYRTLEGSYLTGRTISPSAANEQAVLIAHDRERRPPFSDGPGFFDFAKILQEFSKTAWDDADAFGAVVVSKINKIAEAADAIRR